MLETFIKLLERFVVAHELIAANSAKQTIIEEVGEVVRAVETPAVETPVDVPEEAIDVPEEKPARKPRRATPAEEKQKEEQKGPDLAGLRDEIKTIAKHIAAGDSDDCADLFDEMLEDYKVRTVTKLSDDDVEAFHKDAKTLVAKYYDVEED